MTNHAAPKTICDPLSPHSQSILYSRAMIFTFLQRRDWIENNKVVTYSNSVTREDHTLLRWIVFNPFSRSSA